MSMPPFAQSLTHRRVRRLRPFPAQFPPELTLAIAKVAGLECGYLRRMNKSTTTLITRSDIAWAEAGQVAFIYGLEGCWNYVVDRCFEGYEKQHIPVLEAYLSDITTTLLEETLASAADKNSFEVTKLVLGKLEGQASNVKDQALITATKKRRIAIVDLLLKARPSRSALDQSLIYASVIGCTKMVDAMLKMYTYPQHIKDESLIRAASKSGTTVQALLNAGANPRARNHQSLCIAAHHNRIAITNLLLEAGAKVMYIGYQNALGIAAQKGHYLVKKLLRINPPQNACNIALVQTIQSTLRDSNNIRILQLLTTVANIHSDDDRALRYAALNNRLDCIKVLCSADERGYKASWRTSANGSQWSGIREAMDTAKRANRVKIVKFFQEFF
ncbi:hypothetical protein HDV00_009824 [Rhizophlyctis rosea]|nr:hypothetical protein HDV00_009824 [Rhizophlyctis rosea]